jgi:hypothetical protein
MTKKDEQDAAEQLDTYLNRPDSAPGTVPPETAAVIGALREAAVHVKPRPGFVNELAQELRARENIITQPEKPRSLLVRALAGGLTLVGAVALIVVIAGLFARPANEPALADIDDTPPSQPALIANAERGFLAGTELQVMEAPSSEPQRIAGYTYEPVPAPATAQELRAVAARFGMEDVRVYRQSPGNGLTAFAADGRSLAAGEPAGGRGGFYYSDPRVAPEAGDPLPFAESAAIAEAFLLESGYSPEGYELQPSDLNAQSALTSVRIIPLLDGRPVMGSSESTVTVNGAGEVLTAHILPFAATPTGEMIDAGSSRDALDQLLNGTGNYSYNWNQQNSGADHRVFTPSSVAGSPGETVTVTGWPTILADLETGESLVQLYGAGGAMYLITDLDLGKREGDPAVAQRGLAVTGRLEEQLGPRAWRLSALSWEPYSQMPECRSGLVEQRLDGLYLHPDGEEDGYLIAAAPEALESGARVELCADQFALGEALAWHYISVPPMSEVEFSGGGSVGSASAVEVVSVDVTRVPEAVEPALVPGEEASGGAIVDEERAVAAQPMAPSVESPYAPGEQVDVVGRVTGAIQLAGDERIHEIFLAVDTDGDPATFAVGFRLLGEPELLDAISEHYYLQVAVTGTIVDTGDWAQAIEVASFERVSPGEQIKGFLGQMSVETIEGREVTVFTDEASGGRFAVNPAAGALGLGGEEVGRVWLSGVVAADETFAGLPVLEVLTQSRGTQIDSLEHAGELPLELTMPVYDPGRYGPRGELGDSLIVERIVLGYRMDSVPVSMTEPGQPPTEFNTMLRPAWLFEGYTADGRARFTIQLPLGDNPPAAVPFPTPTPLPMRGE